MTKDFGTSILRLMDRTTSGPQFGPRSSDPRQAVTPEFGYPQ